MRKLTWILIALVVILLILAFWLPAHAADLDGLAVEIELYGDMIIEAFPAADHTCEEIQARFWYTSQNHPDGAWTNWSPWTECRYLVHVNPDPGVRMRQVQFFSRWFFDLRTKSLLYLFVM